MLGHLSSNKPLFFFLSLLVCFLAPKSDELYLKSVARMIVERGFFLRSLFKLLKNGGLATPVCDYSRSGFPGNGFGLTLPNLPPRQSYGEVCE